MLRRVLPQKIFLQDYFANDSTQIKYPYVGNYRYTLKSNLAKYEKMVMQRIEEVPREFADFSSYMMDFLDKMLVYCAENDLNIYLVNPPVHDFILNLVPEELGVLYDEVVQGLQSRHDVTILDYMTFPLADSMFVNQNHLNHYGAEVISKKVAAAMAGDE